VNNRGSFASVIKDFYIEKDSLLNARNDKRSKLHDFKNLFECVKKKFTRIINVEQSEDLDFYLEYTNYFSELLVATIKDFIRISDFNFVQSKYYLSGSIAISLADVKSDIDIVILNFDEKKNIPKIEFDFVKQFENFFSVNIDLVHIVYNGTSHILSEDIIDRIIGLSPQVKPLASNRAQNIYGLNKLNIKQLVTLFFDHLLLGYLPFPPERDSNDIKYSSGGIRDLNFILDNLGRFLISEDFKNDRKYLNELYLKSWENYKRLKGIDFLNSLSNNIHFDEKDIEIILENTWSIKNELVKYIIGNYTNVDYKLYSEIVERRKISDYLSITECKRFLSKYSNNYLDLHILSTTLHSFNEFRDHFVLGRYAYSLLANEFTSSKTLEILALLKGYEWRNLRDQVLKHPNISDSIISLLAKDELLYTSQRARFLKDFRKYV
jgi:predicted nucleotidyltransferase